MHLELQARCTLNHKQPNQLAANPGAVASKRKVCLPGRFPTFSNKLELVQVAEQMPVTQQRFLEPLTRWPL
jgi:hypothetical protein